MPGRLRTSGTKPMRFISASPVFSLVAYPPHDGFEMLWIDRVQYVTRRIERPLEEAVVIRISLSVYMKVLFGRTFWSKGSKISQYNPGFLSWSPRMIRTAVGLSAIVPNPIAHDVFIPNIDTILSLMSSCNRTIAACNRVHRIINHNWSLRNSSRCSIQQNADTVPRIIANYEVWQCISVEVTDRQPVRRRRKLESLCALETAVAITPERPYGRRLATNNRRLRNHNRKYEVKLAIPVQIGDSDIGREGIRWRRRIIAIMVRQVLNGRNAECAIAVT